jgi:hypothetical protein
MLEVSISPKYIEIIMLLLHKQNKQLIKIISENEHINIDELLPAQNKLLKELNSFIK